MYKYPSRSCRRSYLGNLLGTDLDTIRKLYFEPIGEHGKKTTLQVGISTWELLEVGI